MQLRSVSRFRAGAKYKRLYGSSTATVFEVTTPCARFFVEAYGPNPGTRKTIAKQAAKVIVLSGHAGSYPETKPAKAFPPQAS